MFNSLRINLPYNMFDDAPFAGGVHALQHQQHRAVVAAAPVGVQHLLQQPQAFGPFRLQGLAILPRPVEPRRGTGIDIGEVQTGSVAQSGRVDPEGHVL
ncbi:Uncharacterised protein [Mycobacteroides abscessus subsp. massiliense]|nr:Uncharacterised protein [Mycobacteroides abscessus subsp. massiliense]